jgi:hypothetical protein
MINKRYLKITMLVVLAQVNFSLLSSDPSKNLGAKTLGFKALYQKLLQKAKDKRAELIMIGRSAWTEGPDFYDASLAEADQGIAELEKNLRECK